MLNARRALLLLVAAATMAVAPVAATPAHSASALCWGGGCNLGPPYDSGCAAAHSGVVAGTFADDFRVTLWYSNGCAANWGEINFSLPSTMHTVAVASESSANNDNGREVAATDGWGDTLMVDGTFRAQACGQDGNAYVCTRWV
jgi:hypothetical protein